MSATVALKQPIRDRLSCGRLQPLQQALQDKCVRFQNRTLSDAAALRASGMTQSRNRLLRLLFEATPAGIWPSAVKKKSIWLGVLHFSSARLLWSHASKRYVIASYNP